MSSNKIKLETVRSWLAIARENNNKLAIQIIENLFPELCGSEDKRIRKELIKYLPYCDDISKDTKERWIAWLEKQGEQKSIEQDTEIHDLWVYIREWKDKFGRLPKDEDELVACIDYVMKRHKPADKVEPRFKKGDWIVYCNEDVDLITGIEDNGYLINEGGYIPFTSQGDMRLWTIQDAKDGDVLVAKIDEEPNDFIYIFKEYDQNLGFWSHCYLDTYINKFHEGEHHNNYNVGVPATKEQRDLLFSKMKEAGYEWDAGKKELKKIEQNPAWSEEDERIYNEIIDFFLDDIETRCTAHSRKQRHFGYWLKSLKERVQSQPKQEWSEADEKIMKRVDSLLYSQCQIHGSEYEELHNWLKCLKESMNIKNE